MSREKENEKRYKKENPFELYLQEIELAQVKISASVSALRHKLIAESNCYKATLDHNDRLVAENYKLRNPSDAGSDD